MLELYLKIPIITTLVFSENEMTYLLMQHFQGNINFSH